MTKEEQIEEAFKIYCEDTKGALSSVNTWWDLNDETRKIYLAKVDNDRITMMELKEWFGDNMPFQVFDFIFKTGPGSMTLREAKAHIRQMALEYRSPPSLSKQAFDLFNAVKKNGNLTPTLENDIKAWERRYYIWRAEADAPTD